MAKTSPVINTKLKIIERLFQLGAFRPNKILTISKEAKNPAQPPRDIVNARATIIIIIQ